METFRKTDSIIMSRIPSQEKHFKFFNCVFQKQNRRLKANQEQIFELIAEQHVPPLIAKGCTVQGDELLEPVLFTAWGPELGDEYGCKRILCHRWAQGEEVSCVCMTHLGSWQLLLPWAACILTSSSSGYDISIISGLISPFLNHSVRHMLMLNMVKKCVSTTSSSSPLLLRTNI